MALSIRRKPTHNTLLRRRASTIRLPEKGSLPIPQIRLVHTPSRHPKLYPTPTQSPPRPRVGIPQTTCPGVFPRPWIFGWMSNHRERTTTGVNLRFLWKRLVPSIDHSSHRPTILPVEERAMSSQG